MDPEQRAAATANDQRRLRPAGPRSRIPALGLLVPLLAAPAGCKTLLPSGVDHWPDTGRGHIDQPEPSLMSANAKMTRSPRPGVR